MFRRLVIIVLSLLAIVSGLYWIDIYRPRTTIADLESRVETLARQLDETCGVSWREREEWSDLKAACPEGEPLRSAHVSARSLLRHAQKGDNVTYSYRWTSLREIQFKVVKCSRLAAGQPSRRLGSIAEVSFSKRPKSYQGYTTPLNAKLGGFSVYYCESPPAELSDGSKPTILRVTAPLWALSLLFATYPVIAFLRGPLRRRRRRVRGLCTACGYNLTGLPTAICPECGMAGQGKSLKDSGCDE